MPIPFDHAFVVFLVLFFPVRAWSFGYRRLQRALPEDVPRVRGRLYREAILLQWTLALAVMAAWMALARPVAWLGLVPRFDAWTAWLPAGLRGGFPWALAVPALTIALVALVLASGRSARRSDESLARVREQLRDVERLMPTDAGEMRAFLVLSLTAGVCEELLFRGYLMWYFAGVLGPWGAALATSALFGIGHLYQGPRGILKTGLVGYVFAVLTLASGSIVPAIVLHALLDAHSGSLAWHALRRERELAYAPAAHGPAAEGA